MEEYNKIAKLLQVPSFITLLLSISIILLTYSNILYSRSQIVLGIFIFLFSLIFLVYNLWRNKKENSKSSSNDEDNEEKNIFFRFFTLYALLPVSISFIILLRVLSLISYDPIDKKDKSFAGIVESVIPLRYSNEVILKFGKYVFKNKEITENNNRAIAYIQKDIIIQAGDEVELLTKPTEIRPGLEKESAFEISLLRRGLPYIFYIDENNIKIRKKAPRSFKNKIRNLIEENFFKLFDKKTIPILKALYFGNKSYIDKTTIADFKRSGALHVLAASGLHVIIIVSSIILLLTPLMMNRKIILIITSMAVLFYLYITDMPVSLLRAFAMYSIFSIQYIFDVEKNILNTLFLSAIIILIIYPYELFNLGFQLSFGATGGIIFFFNQYKEAFSYLPSILSKSLSATISAQTFVFPVIYIHMKEVNLLGILSNFIIILTIGFTLVSSLFVNLISTISISAAKIFALTTDTAYTISLYFVNQVSKLNGHFIIKENNYFLLLLFFIFLIPAIPMVKKKKVMSMSVIIALVLAFFILSNNNFINNNISILKRQKTNVVLVNINQKTVVYGDLKSIDHARILINYINSNNFRNIILYIPNPNYINLKSFTYFMKQTLVEKCYLSSTFLFLNYFKKFCRALDEDGVKLEIKEFKDFRTNKMKEFSTQQIENFFQSPIDNIENIYLILFGKYSLTRATLIEHIYEKYLILFID